MKDKPGENMPLFNAKVNIAAQRKNAQERYGSNVDGRSGMASPTMSGLGYAEALSATVTAVENRGAGRIRRMERISSTCVTTHKLSGAVPFA